MSQCIGNDMYELAKVLFPVHRSITGDGVRKTLKILQEYIPITIREIDSGKQVFDWIIPKEWNIRDAYIKDTSGKKIVDFKKNNLSIVGYSLPINKTIGLEELQEHLHSLPDQPDAIPYVTSYYENNWGFCLPDSTRKTLKNGEYTVVIDSDFKNGSLTYGELIIPGKDDKEVFISTNICHPSMANNETSGPVVATFLAKWALSCSRRYTYRIIFIPETIGAITYLSENLKHMKENVIAGFVLSCIGDNGPYSYVPTKNENTYVDKVVLHTMSQYDNAKKYSFIDRGSDERQYNMPGIDIPAGCISRSKFCTYPEYHTSLDDLNFVSSEGFNGSYSFMVKCLNAIENNYIYKTKCLGEPQLGKRNMCSPLGTKFSIQSDKTTITAMLTYADGKNDLIDIANKIGQSVEELYCLIDKLMEFGLIGIED